MDLWDAKEFRFPALLKEPLTFQSRLKSFFDVLVPPPGFRVIKGNGELINNSYINGVVYLGPGAVIKPFSYVEGRLFLDEGASLGPHAFIRSDVYVGKSSVIGRCEVKHSILMDYVNVHHHGYIGDSILGNRVNIAAGFVTANLRFDKLQVNVKGYGLSPTYKFGSLIGDDVKTMVNAYLMPGSVISKCGVVLAPRVESHGKD